MNHSPQIDVSIIIVNYRQNAMLMRCLESLTAKTQGIVYEVIVVDNAPDEIFLNRLRRTFSEVAVIKSPENVGFARANNAAAAVSRGRHLFFVNPDIVFESNAAAGLVRFLDARPEAGAVGCRLDNEDGSLQFSIRQFPTIGNQLAEAFFLHHVWRRSSKLSIMTRDKAAYAKTRAVQWLTGAAIMIRRSAFESVNAFDEDFFLYAEEVDLCFRLRKAGWLIYYSPDANLVHVGGESDEDPGLLAQLVASNILFFTKNYSTRQLPALRFALVLRLAVRYLTWLAAAFLKPSAGQARRRLGYYRNGLEVALSQRPSPRQLPGLDDWGRDEVSDR